MGTSAPAGKRALERARQRKQYIRKAELDYWKRRAAAHQRGELEQHDARVAERRRNAGLERDNVRMAAKLATRRFRERCGDCGAEIDLVGMVPGVCLSCDGRRTDQAYDLARCGDVAGAQAELAGPRNVLTRAALAKIREWAALGPRVACELCGRLKEPGFACMACDQAASSS